jgi:hypothetical protein
MRPVLANTVKIGLVYRFFPGPAMLVPVMLLVSSQDSWRSQISKPTAADRGAEEASAQAEVFCPKKSERCAQPGVTY